MLSNREAVGLKWLANWNSPSLRIVLGCVLIATLIACLVILLIPPTYKSSTLLLIEPSPGLVTDDYSSIIAGEQLAFTYSQLMVEKQILETAIRRLELDLEPEDLARRVSAEPVSNTQLIRLSVRDSSPQNAALLAETIADEFVQHVRLLEREKFGESISGLQAEMESQTTLLSANQARVDSLSSQSIAHGAKMVHLQSQIDLDRGDYQFLQQSYFVAQSQADQIAEKIQIVEDAVVKEAAGPRGFSAYLTLLVDPSLIIGQGTYSTVTNSARVASAYGEIWTGESYMQAVIDELGLDRDADDLANDVNFEPIPSTQLVRLRVDDPSAAQAKMLVEVIGRNIVQTTQTQLARPYTDRMQALQKQMDELSAQIESAQAEIMTISAQKAQIEADLIKEESAKTKLSQDYQVLYDQMEQLRKSANQASNSVMVVAQPSIPDRPTQDRLLYVLLAALLGGTVGIGAAFVLDQLDETVRIRQDVTSKMGLNLLGCIDAQKNGDSGLEMDVHPRSKVAEDFRTLAINLCSVNAQNPIRTLLISSPGMAEGKSVVTANLALALARLGLKILVVDADLRLPSLHRIFGVDQENGLSEALVSGKEMDHLKTTKEAGVKIMTSGSLPPNPSELLNSKKLTILLEKLSQQADLVLVDSPPILSVADSMILAAELDGTMLVARSGMTTRKMLREAEENLRQVRGNLIGVVLNGVPRDQHSAYRYESGEEERSSAQRWFDVLQYWVKTPWFKKK